MPFFIDDLEAALAAVGTNKPGIALGIAMTPWENAQQRDEFLATLTQQRPRTTLDPSMLPNPSTAPPPLTAPDNVMPHHVDAPQTSPTPEPSYTQEPGTPTV